VLNELIWASTYWPNEKNLDLGAMKYKYLIAVLRTMKIPGLFPIMRDWQAHVRMHFINAGLESGILEALSTHATRDQLLEKLQPNRPEIMDAILDVGVTTKELARKNSLYSIKGKRSKAVVGKGGDVLAAMIQANTTCYSSAYRNAPERMYGGPLGDDLERIGALVARFARIGEPIVRQFIAEIVAGKDSMNALDVGCGSGIFLQSVCTAN
jgi:hypothetical protein